MAWRIDEYTGFDLFVSRTNRTCRFPCTFPVPTGFVTPQHAAAVLRHLARTGEVNWSVKETPMDDTESPYETRREVVSHD